MIFELQPFDYVISLVIITTGTILQGSVGFGLGLLAVPLLLLIDPAFVPGPILLIAFFLNIMMSYRERKDVDVKSLKWIITGRILGTIIGATVLKVISEQTIGLLFGSLILLAVVFSASGIHLAVKPGNLLSVGTLSGFMATTIAVGGPPLALLYQKSSGTRLRGTLAITFLIGTIVAVISLIIINKFGMKELMLSFGVIPGILLGFYLSGKTTRYLDRGFIRPAVLIVSTISALVVIIKYLG